MGTSDQRVPYLIDDTNLPYVKNVNPATRPQRPYLTDGSNMLVHKDEPLSKRPGFSQLYTTFGTNEKVHHVFGWNNVAGTYRVMLNVINTVAGTSKIYNGATLIYTDSTSTAPFDFVVANNFLFFGNGVKQGKWDGTTVTNWGISDQPSADTPTINNVGAGNVPGAIGHFWVYAFGVSATGYLSDISLASAESNAAARKWDITGDKCADTQCDKVHIYRTEDGGATFYELSNSPIANPGGATWTIQDNDRDEDLQPTIAPVRGVNQPPPLLTALVFYAGRIWGVNGSRQYFSGFEEVTNGVPVESFGTQLTNSFEWGEVLTAQAVLTDIKTDSSDFSTLLVMSGGTIFSVSGDTRDTFVRNTVALRRGCRNRFTIISSQIDSKNPTTGVETTISFVAWLDSSSTIRMITRDLGIRDISKDIESDLTGIDHLKATMTVYETTAHRWLVFCDGEDAVLRTFDLESNHWNVPWPIATMTCVGSAEVSIGVYHLIIGFGTKALSQVETSTPIYTDDGTNYTAFFTTCAIPLGDVFRPEQVNNFEYVALETEALLPATVKYMTNADPYTISGFVDTVAAVTPFLRSNAASPPIEGWYQPAGGVAGARRVSIKVSWAASDLNLKLFTLCVVSERVGDS